MKHSINKIFQYIPYSIQKYLFSIYSVIKFSFFSTLIKFFMLNSKIRSGIPFYYLKYFPYESLKKWYIKISEKTDLKKWFKVLAPWKIEIWDYTYLAGNNFLTPSDTNYIKIWKFCSIAEWVSIIAWYYHDYNKFTTSPYPVEDYQLWAPIEIWNDVRIWRNAIILKWVKIWDGAVIWAGSVITKDIPPYAIVWWNPAKIIKYRFNQEKIEILLKSQRWKKDLETIKKNELNYEKWIFK